jgi:YesN/AraC family two-component response regulator
VTLEYFELTPEFTYPEETHDFYEFVFLKRGNVICHTDGRAEQLTENDLYLITPNTKHRYSIPKNDSSTVFIVCFKSKSTALNLISGKSVLTKEMQEVLWKILTKAKETFAFPFNKKLELKENPKLGSQQLIENYIEELLINLIQAKTAESREIQVVSNYDEMKKSIVLEIVKYLKENLYTKTTLSDISDHTYYSKTYINGLFKEVMDITIMQYYQKLKIKEAEKLIMKSYAISKISELLNFESPHYFCKVFKKTTGSTVSEYKKKLRLYTP